MDRQAALELLQEYTQKEGLLKHAYAVEAAMCAYARKFNQDETKFGIVGLLHDFDYEATPDPKDHPMRGAKILKQQGYPEDVIYAIKSHASYLGLERHSLMDKALFAVDELVGFITAVTLVRPSKNIHDVKVSSVRKKMKAVAFARSVSREDIIEGSESLELDLNIHISNVIEALQGEADILGLTGE